MPNDPLQHSYQGEGTGDPTLLPPCILSPCPFISFGIVKYQALLHNFPLFLPLQNSHLFTFPPARGGGVLPYIRTYKPYRYVPPQRVRFLDLFGLKTAMHFAYSGLESGMVFEGTTGEYERNYCFSSKWIRKK